MAIDIDEFESADPAATEATNAERVGRFLLDHRDRAFKAAEIADRTGVNQNSIHPVLRRLEEQGLIRHKRPYWAIGDVDALRSALTYHETAEFMDEELGEERREAWLAAGDQDDE